MDVPMTAQTKAVEDENRRLKKMFAERSMQNEVLKEALGKSSWAIHCPAVDCNAINERVSDERWPQNR